MKIGRRHAALQGLFASVAASALLVGTAFTANATPPAMTWSGFYVGANLGWYQTSLRVNDLNGWYPQLPCCDIGGRSWSLTNNGVLGGVQTGFNWQFDHIMVGIEGDYDFGNASGSANGAVPSKYSVPMIKSSISGLGTIRGRLGYAFDPLPILVYGTAGVAYGQVNNKVTDSEDPSTATWQSNQFQAGYVVGGGLEYAFNANWSVKAEGLYVNLGSSTAQNYYGCHFTFRDTAVVARGGINYKF